MAIYKAFYNRFAAFQYATTWALRRNPDYEDYSSANGGGGDCTNFISQCLLAGGWPMIEDGAIDSVCWYRKFDRSPSGNADDWSVYLSTSKTWASASWFYRFLTMTSRVRPCGRNDMIVGDIAMLQGPGFAYPDHAMMVTKRTNRDLFVSYHSTDNLDHPLSEIEGRYSKQTKYLYFKVLDLFDAEKRAPAAERPDYTD